MRKLIFACFLLALAACGGGDRGSRVVIQNKGSDTLVNVAQGWAEAYKAVNPNVAVAVTGGGTGTGISALINGTVDLANASREMSREEIEMAKKRGFSPVKHVVGYDALAVYLHNNNPIDQFTFDQLAGIYGEGGELEEWNDLGVDVPGCSSGEIVRVSRQNNSGTYVYFRDTILAKNQDYKLGSRDMHGSKDVVDLVAHTPCAIGYSGLAYATESVKRPCIAENESSPCIEPKTETAVDGSYPVSRPLIMYTQGEPEGVVKEYLDWILSDEGQCIIREKGYAPVRHVECN